MDFQEAQLLSESLGRKLKELGRKSYPRLSPVPSEEGTYVVKIVLHPDEDDLQRKYPGAPFSPWAPSTGEQYSEKTPRTPSRREAPYDDWYPTFTKRRTEPSTHYPDTNPNYPGLRRVPEIQDLVRRVAMRPDLKDRLETVKRKMASLERLSYVIGRHSESCALVEDLLTHLKDEGYSGRTKCVRLVKKLKDAMKADGYSFG